MGLHYFSDHASGRLLEMAQKHIKPDSEKMNYYCIWVTVRY